MHNPGNPDAIMYSRVARYPFNTLNQYPNAISGDADPFLKVSSLPVKPYPAGYIVLNEADGKMYYSNGTTWQVVATAADIQAGLGDDVTFDDVTVTDTATFDNLSVTDQLNLEGNLVVSGPSSGITLPDPGGYGALLTTYQSDIVYIGLNFTHGESSTINVPLYCSRIGNLVTISIPYNAFIISGTSSLYSDAGAIPVAYRPTSDWVGTYPLIGTVGPTETVMSTVNPGTSSQYTAESTGYISAAGAVIINPAITNSATQIAINGVTFRYLVATN
jgi:hypothetical protein